MKSLISAIAFALAAGAAAAAYADQPSIGVPVAAHAGVNTYSFRINPSETEWCIPQTGFGDVTMAALVSQALVNHREIQFSAGPAAYCRPPDDGPAVLMNTARNISLLVP